MTPNPGLGALAVAAADQGTHQHPRLAAARSWQVHHAHGRRGDARVDWSAAPGATAVRAGYAQVRIEGVPGDFIDGERVPLARSSGAANLSVIGHAEQLRVALPGIFEQPELGADEVALDARIKGTSEHDWFIDVAQLRIANDDLDVRLQGSGAGKARARRVASTCAARWCAAP